MFEKTQILTTTIQSQAVVVWKAFTVLYQPPFVKLVKDLLCKFRFVELAAFPHKLCLFQNKTLKLTKPQSNDLSVFVRG